MLTAKAAALPPDGQPEIGPSETKSDRDFERRVPRECPGARDCEPAPKATKNRPRDSPQRRTIVWLSPWSKLQSGPNCTKRGYLETSSLKNRLWAIFFEINYVLEGHGRVAEVDEGLRA